MPLFFQRVTNFAQQNHFFGRGGGCRCFGLYHGGFQLINVLHQNEHHEGHNKEFDDGIDEQPIHNKWRTGLLCGFQRCIAAEREVEVIVAEINAADDHADDGVDNVRNQRADDGGERCTDDDTDGQIDHVAAGVESMTRIPMGGYNPLPNPVLYKNLPEAYISMGLTAENVAKRFKIERKDQEAFAIKSHQKAAAANFAEEIVPIHTKGGVVDKDGTIRADSTPEDLAKLSPVFDVYGTVTAGTSSPLTDGAAAVLVVSEEYAKKHKLKPLARIKSMAVTGLDPAVMGLGPITASQKALAKAGLKIGDIDVVELNEAFAAQSLPFISELGCDITKVNAEGGAIALGHPLGASGARITGKAALLLSRSKGKYALATACIGGGQGIATILEKI